MLTVDGRILIGTLFSADNLTNLVLSEAFERIIQTPDSEEDSMVVEHGVYLVRGDNVVVCGEVDDVMDQAIDWSKVRGQVIESTKNA